MNFDTSDVIENTVQQSIMQFALHNLEAVVAIDSCSDENSTHVPSTEGQMQLAQHLVKRFEILGAQVQLDSYANVIAYYPGQGQGEKKDPLVFMVHLDTAMGTQALPCLNTHEQWDGSPLQFSSADAPLVSLKIYPHLRHFLDQTLVYGSGKAPFGLDDKLGLTHLLSLAWLIQDQQISDYPPLYFVARPDEEIGRDDALIALSEKLAQWGVKRGYTVDGIEPFEVNLANFNAAQFTYQFPCVLPANPSSPVDTQKLQQGIPIRLKIKGINTHGATAKVEGHRSALRFVCELWHQFKAYKDQSIRYCDFIVDDACDCHAECVIWTADLACAAYAKKVCQDLIQPHYDRGARIDFTEYIAKDPSQTLMADTQLESCLVALHTLMFEEPLSIDDPMWAEDSSDWQGYTQPFTLLKTASQQWTLKFRVRDFSTSGLEQRIKRLIQWAQSITHLQGESQWHHQYQNMYTVLQKAPELVRWAENAGHMIQQESKVLPIRGGTGIDPFLQHDILLANLGTGYFAPESEKEFTSTQMMYLHALWLAEIVSQSACE